MKTFEAMLKEFRLQFVPQHPTPAKPIVVPDDRKKLCMELIKEEVIKELLVAMESGDLELIADSIMDSHYVLSYASVEYGIPEQRCFEEVHRSNMTKLWPFCLVEKRYLTEEELATVGNELPHNANNIEHMHYGDVPVYCNNIILKPKYREDGKVLKPPTYSPANLKPLLGL